MKKGWKGTGFGSPTKSEMDELYEWLIHSDWVQSDGDGAWELTYLGHKLLILLNEIKKKGKYEDSFGVKDWKGTGINSPTKNEMSELYRWLMDSDWVKRTDDGCKLSYMGHKLLILLNEIKKKGSHKIIYTTYEDSFGVTRLGELLATVWFNTFCKGKGRFK